MARQYRKFEDLFLAELGRVAANFQAVESELTRFIAVLLQPVITSPMDLTAGYIVANELRYSAKVAVLMAIYERRVNDRDRVKKLRKIMGRVASLEDKRNTFLHSSWRRKRDGTIDRLKSQTTLRYGYVPKGPTIQEGELGDYADSAYEISIELSDAGNDFVDYMYEQQEQFSLKGREPHR